MNQQPLFNQTGETLRDQGMKQALDNAEKEVPNWSDLALEKVREFVCAYPHLEFMTENVREWAHHGGLPEPPHRRAWGGVMAKAANRNLIVKVGMGQVKNPKAHCANANIWRKKHG